MGAASTAVADLYHELGLDVAGAAHELPDHIAIELEALAYAAGRDDPAAARVADALLGEHLGTWVPAFCHAVEAESGRAVLRGPRPPHRRRGSRRSPADRAPPGA